MPVDPPPFLLPPRSGDRCFPFPHSPWHQGALWVPHGRGRVRLQLCVPWIGAPGDTRHRLSLVVVWQKPLRLPAPSKVADSVAGLFRAPPQRTRGPGLDRFPLKVESWRGEVFTQKTDRALLPHVPRADAWLCVREALAWASRLLSHRWPSYHSEFGWVYSAHRFTALLVADEIARRYFEDRRTLGNISRLQRALPELRRRIEAAYRVQGRLPRVTPRRLALALVDHVLGPLFPHPLLAQDRLVGLSDGKLWNLVFPPQYRPRLKALLPAESVHALLSWQKREREESPAANWFLTWWFNLLNVGGPYAPGRWSDAEVSPFPEDPGRGEPGRLRRGPIRLLAFPGVEEWAAIVWDALYA